jgi:hypothetical protein
MKIKFGSLVVDGRGKIGGHVASKNRSGAYMRTKVTPVNRRSAAQIGVRSTLAGISVAWRGLTADQIAAWNAAVSDYQKTDIFGDIKKPTGFTLYQKLNNNAIRCGGTAIDVPPLPSAVPYVSSLSAQVSTDGAVDLTFAASPVPAGQAYIVSATRPLSAGISFVKSEFRIIKILAAAASSPVTLDADYAAVFGAPSNQGSKVFFQVKIVELETGIAGTPIQISAIVRA